MLYNIERSDANLEITVATLNIKLHKVSPDYVKSKLKHGQEAWVIYVRDNDLDDWSPYKVVTEKSEMRKYVEDLNDQRDYQRYSATHVTK